MTQKTCFVLMGFAEKTDYRTQRTLDLDKTYKIIRAAVEECDVKCIRADDIVHSGVIDIPMYEQLLEADIAIADLSTSNENAIYELGVRHALRPHTTIVIAESEFSFPFDLNHLLIRHYKHLGSGIDFEEADRLKSVLKVAITELIDKHETDSPVYSSLPNLRPPARSNRLATTPADGNDGKNEQSDKPTFSTLLESYHNARSSDDFTTAKTIIALLRKLQPKDPYLIQQQALVTYKSKLPDPVSALEEARVIIADKLSPLTTNDPETLGLWGAIHKRLWELKQEPGHLDQSITAYERGFFLRRDYYTGINYAFMLNVRAAIQEKPDEAIADRVIANRTRKQILDIIDETQAAMPRDNSGLPVDQHEAYWLGATRLEALLGLGELDRLKQEKIKLYNAAPENWMKDSTETQLEQLETMCSE